MKDDLSKPDDRSRAYEESALRLENFLSSQQEGTGANPSRASWGYSFSALFHSLGATPERDLLRRSLDAQAACDTQSALFPWEFVHYALLRMEEEKPGGITQHSSGAAGLLQSREIVGTRSTNWRLLRLVNDALRRERSFMGKCEAAFIRHVFTSGAGLIQDRLGTRSLQYHAFSLFLVCELHRLRGWSFLDRWIREALTLSCRQVFCNGSALLLGRGQEQIFGYGALLYAMEYGRVKLAVAADQQNIAVLRRVLSFQRADGSFPLVLRAREPESPNPKIEDCPPGWYGYNTLYDYLPFLGYCLRLCARVTR